MRRQEYENKRMEYEASRKNKRKTVGPGGAPLEKKKRKQKAGAASTACAAAVTAPPTPGTPTPGGPVVASGEIVSVDAPKKRSKKTKVSFIRFFNTIFLIKLKASNMTSDFSLSTKCKGGKGRCVYYIIYIMLLIYT